MSENNELKSIIVTYDLNNSGKNYDDLIEAIKKYSHWAKINKSVWFIKSNQKCTKIRDNLKSVIDDDDSLFVAELTGTAAWSNVICDNNHLKKYL